MLENMTGSMPINMVVLSDEMIIYECSPQKLRQDVRFSSMILFSDGWLNHQLVVSLSKVRLPDLRGRNGEGMCHMQVCRLHAWWLISIP